ncbi:MAG: MarR family winged helix-turn-helix transcriptional regulator [Vulcanibacillus sp.]
MNNEKNYELAILKLLELIALLRKKQHNDETIINEIGLTQSYFNILFIIENFNGISISELSQKTGISIPNSSKAVENLVNLTLLERKNDASDKRVSNIYLSKQGLAVINKYKESLKDKLKEKIICLDEDDINILVNSSNDLVKVLLKIC